jgi:phage/plasmid primase-like uncharacterized protein
MRFRECSICGSEAGPTYLDVKGKGTRYGAECAEGHAMEAVFGTKNRAAQAWNECQEFVERYTEDG